MAVILEGNTGNWEIVIGLEVHAQVKSKSKLFSSASTEFGAEPNSQVDFVDAAMPGTLPVLNKFCVRQAVKTGLAFGAEVNLRSVFERKNYFYPDLPLGYQISQFKYPIVTGGVVKALSDDGSEKIFRINHIHLEQDAGKSIHESNNTFVDLNRAGVALMEIVSEPDMRSPLEASNYVKKLRTVLQYIGACDGNMEEGQLRCDANVSVRREGAKELGTRREIKNLNSMKNIMDAIIIEAKHQIEVIESGGIVAQETLLYDADNCSICAVRSKEDARDYRYFPDPDLLPLVIEEHFVKEVAAELPELPDERYRKYVEDMNLPSDDAFILSSDKNVSDYFEKLVVGRDSKLVSTWMLVELFGRLNKQSISMSDCPITVENFGSLLDLIKDNTISGKIGKTVLDFMFETPEKEPKSIVEEKGLVQITDESAIESVIDEVLSANVDKVEEYRSGKDRLYGFFVGQVMKKMQGKGNPDAINRILKKKLA